MKCNFILFCLSSLKLVGTVHIDFATVQYYNFAGDRFDRIHGAGISDNSNINEVN